MRYRATSKKERRHRTGIFRLRPPLGDRRACRVVWRTQNALGVKFTDRRENDDGFHVEKRGKGNV
jgi:hypothetical protein